MVTFIIIILISFAPNDTGLPLEVWEALQEKGKSKRSVYQNGEGDFNTPNRYGATIACQAPVYTCYLIFTKTHVAGVLLSPYSIR